MDSMGNNETQTEGINTTDPTGQSKEKLFTQDEVNEIVKSRLARERKTLNTGSNQEVKEQSLHDRELSLLERETLFTRGLPKELAGMIKFTDEKDLNSKLDILDNLLSNSNKKEESDSLVHGFRQIGVGRDNGSSRGVDPVRKAMGLK